MQDVSATTFNLVLDYLYLGRLDKTTLTFEASRDLLIAANMWQMADLETAVMEALAEACTPQRFVKECLTISMAYYSDIRLIYGNQSEGGNFSTSTLSLQVPENLPVCEQC